MKSIRERGYVIVGELVPEATMDQIESERRPYFGQVVICVRSRSSDCGLDAPAVHFEVVEGSPPTWCVERLTSVTESDGSAGTENQHLSCHRDEARTLPEELLRLMGSDNAHGYGHVAEQNDG